MKLIVVVDDKWGIGKNNGLLFRLKKDMRFFRETTTGKIVVVGANTFRGFPNGALPDRVNIVLDDSGQTHFGAVTAPSVTALRAQLKLYDTDDVYVCGGASVYKLLLDECDTALVTKVNADGQADTFFPDLDGLDNWSLQEKSPETDDGGYKITFCKYVNTKFLR